MSGKKKEKLLAEAEVADRAADKIMIHGGTTGELIDSRGRVCLLGAVAFASPLFMTEAGEDFYHTGYGNGNYNEFGDYADESDIEELHPRISRAIEKRVGKNPIAWNDAIEPPTDDQRIELLRNVAKDLREEAGKITEEG